MDTTGCPICTDSVAQKQILQGGASYAFVCRRCGSFIIDGLLERILRRPDDEDKRLLPYLSAYVSQHPPSQLGPVRVEKENWREQAALHSATSIPQKADKLLNLIARRTEAAGQQIGVIPELDFPLIDAVSPDECSYLLKHLMDAGYITLELVFRAAEQPIAASVAMAGWKRLETPAGRKGIPGIAFVAMSFHETLDAAYDGIHAAVRACDLPDPVRLDKIEHNEKICDRILAEITRCEFLIADCTLQRPGVYFEAGFAMGLGKEVIWTCRADDLKNVHFDTRQYNYVEWNDVQDLKQKLADRIQGTILIRRR